MKIMLSMSSNHGVVELGTLCVYFAILFFIAFLSYKKQQSGADFILGNRTSNFWLTALSAQASDMGSWLFLGYPALIFGGGVFAAWAAIGLTIGMFLNWHFIAPRLRKMTEQFGSLTLNAYFETRFQDRSGSLRLISGIMSVLFFTIYISSGLIAMGVLLESLFGLNYYLGIAIGLIVVVGYVFMGGYRTVAWIDLFQGFFLLGVIVCIPIYLLHQMGGISWVMQHLEVRNIATSLLPDFQSATLWKIMMTAAGWGLGYFGQPHILTKFMGIRHTNEMWKAKYLGISWLIVTLTAATFAGLIGIVLFQEGLADSQQVILSIVQQTLAPIFVGLTVCAILAATTNVMAAHILIVASNLSEDFYKCHFRKDASSSELLWISRLSVVLIATIGLLIAYFKPSTIYQLVLYAWSGLGASFGPLVLLSLYAKNINKYGAFAGIFIGGITTAVWPYFDQMYQWEVAPIVPGFLFGLIAIQGVSVFARKRLLSAVEL
jgi:SSS family solute:Na+ symporter